MAVEWGCAVVDAWMRWENRTSRIEILLSLHGIVVWLDSGNGIKSQSQLTACLIITIKNLSKMAKGSHSQSVGCPVTRSKNANQHPGTIVAPRKKQTNTEKQRDDEMASLAKEKVANEKQEGIMRVARLEDAMAVDDGNTDSAHPCHYSKPSLTLL